MASIIEALDGLAGKLWCKEWQNPAWKQFLLTGDSKLLNFIPKFRQYSWLPNELLLALPMPDQMTETEQRFLQACLTAGLPQALGAWLRQSLPDEAAQRARFAKAALVAQAAACSRTGFAIQVAEQVRPLRFPNNSLTPAGEFLLSLDDKALAELVAKVCLDARHAPELAQLYALHAPDRWKKLLEQFGQPADVTRIHTSVWVLPLMADTKRFLELAARAFELNENWYARFELGSALRNVERSRFHEPMERLCGERLLAEDTHAHKRLWKQSNQAAEWLVANSGRASLRQLENYIAAPIDTDVWTRKTQGEHKNAVLTLAAQEFKRDVIPLFEAGFATPQPEVQLHALKLWLTIKTPGDAASIATKLAEDTAPIARAEAEKRAQAHAQSMAHYAQYFAQQAQKNPQPQGAPPPPPPMTAEQYYAQALPSMLKQPKGSAIASKGILSVSGACVGGSAVPTVNRYLKEWYGQRAAHCRALLQMLAWVEHRTATQLLLAVGSRFRTKSIQEEANVQAQALADRRGWTVAELADRTIPSAGLDENGIMMIDFGPRQFTAKLNEDLDFVLADAEGKTLKALPEPRKDDDEAKATEAKKNYSAAKKELKAVLTMQRDRLYEAMCTQRTWSFEDWNLYLNRHPIVRHHCERLIWAVVRDKKAVQLFRPLSDGSLTDVADDPVKLEAEDLIRVAHECQVTPEQSQAWRQHFKDYNVETLFDQFGRQNFKLSEENQNETDVADFQGHVLEAFKLRGRANKLGYTRGQAQDGGWFFDYHKRFPTLGIEATIEFTGNGMPEENRTVALTILHFDRVAEGGESFGGASKMMLSEVPSVLLSECWNDIRAIAAEGTGFDPAWEKKTQM